MKLKLKSIERKRRSEKEIKKYVLRKFMISLCLFFLHFFFRRVFLMFSIQHHLKLFRQHKKVSNITMSNVERWTTEEVDDDVDVKSAHLCSYHKKHAKST